jgi:phosphoglycerate dehydrogenase-like enzyme
VRAVYVDIDELGTEPGRSLLEQIGLEVLESRCRTPQDVIEAGAGAAALLVGSVPITRKVLTELPSVGIVSTMSVGTDHVDLAAAADLGVWVTNVPDAATDEVAVHAVAMALSLIRHLPFYDRDTRRGEWSATGPGPMRRPTEMILGIVGMGAIGRRTAEAARASFQRILGCDPFLSREAWPSEVEPTTIEALFREADVVSLHVPLTDETRRLVNADRLGTMRRGSYLVNVSRGELMDMDAVIDALDAGRLAGAAVDVLPTEPPESDDPILRHPRSMVTPHIAYLSEESALEYSRKQALDVIAWIESGRPQRVVVEPSRPRVTPR